MRHKVIYIFLFFIFFLFIDSKAVAQQNPGKEDTFFLAKQKGLLGRLGKSISTTPDEPPQKYHSTTSLSLIRPFASLDSLLVLQGRGVFAHGTTIALIECNETF